MSVPSTPAVEKFHRLWGEVCDLGSAMALLQWDQETTMPPGGAPGRAQATASLAGLHHAKVCAPELADAIAAIAAEATENDDEILAAQAREAERAVGRSNKIPPELAVAIAGATSRALMAWQRARAEDNFAVFRDDLAEVVRLVREQADALADGTAKSRYDALLDLYEPHASEADLAGLFGSLRAELAPLVAAVADSGVDIDESVARGDFTPDAQLQFATAVIEQMGFDLTSGRVDRSTHPFCTTITVGDTRLTWRYETDDFRPALLGMMHEAGHGLYEQGLPRDWARTPLGEAVSMGIHESQSRLWENLVGRSKPFWSWALPRFREHFGFVPDDRDAIWQALHVVRPSLIRVEADEVTYNLHIAVRFELERQLIADKIGVDDLSDLWDDTYDELLGIRPDSAATGILQDIHWSMGAFGYFPTYTLGNLAASQFFAAAEADLGPLDVAIADGDFAGLREWLRGKIHVHGKRYSPSELIEHASHAPLSADAFLGHVRRFCGEIYGV